MTDGVIIAVILALAVIAIVASARQPGPSTDVLTLPAGGERLSMAPWGIPYVLHHQRGTSGGLASRKRNTLIVSGVLDFGALRDTGAHCTLNLRNNVALRNNAVTGGPGVVTMGHGVIFGTMDEGQPDFPQGWGPRFCAVIEQFDKGEGLRVLLPESASPALPDRISYRIESARDGDVMRLRYRLSGEGVEFDSGWHVTQHSMPLDGDDLTRALFPTADVQVQYIDTRVSWSTPPVGGEEFA